MQNLSKLLLTLVVILLFTACGSNGTNTTIANLPSEQQTAINKIIEFALNGQPIPTIEDYATAGVVGVIDTNIAQINEVVANLTQEEVDTTEEIQQLLSELGVVTPALNDTTPPEAPTVDHPVEATQTQVDVTISGEVGTVIFIDNKNIGVEIDADGSKHITLTLKNGANHFTATLRDASQNMSATTKFVIKKIVTVVIHNDLTYGVVTSPHTGKVWLDRNLGAVLICTAFDDTACYGDYYQWGRNADGHQVGSSATIRTQANDVDNVGHSNFITNSSALHDWAIVDNTGATRAANWSKTDGTSICPSGYRVPTEAELEAETEGAGVTNSATAFASFLKLPSAGFRDYLDGSLFEQGLRGTVWSVSREGSSSRGLNFDSSDAYLRDDGRAFAQSVRCLRD